MRTESKRMMCFTSENCSSGPLSQAEGSYSWLKAYDHNDHHVAEFN